MSVAFGQTTGFNAVHVARDTFVGPFALTWLVTNPI